MAGSETETSILLQRWNRGDSSALNQLLERHLAWIENHVHKRVGPLLRQRAETCDFAQDAMIEFLRYGPRFKVSDAKHFRALMACIVENTLRDERRWYTARRRDMARERPLPTDSIIDLDGTLERAATPSQIASRREREAWLRFALELLDLEEREILVMRHFEQRSYKEIGERIGIRPDAARMRFKRAMVHLAEKMGSLRRGELGRSLREEP